MTGDVAMPVWLRVGPAEEKLIGTVTVNVAGDPAAERTALAALLRDVADEIERGSA